MTHPLDFLLLGAPRSGTTSLFRHLKRHPSLFIPAAKELPFFTDEESWRRGWPAFADEFFAAATEGQQWGKLTPHYWDRPEVLPRLEETMPNVRLLALLRNPVDRAFSHYRFLVRRGVEPLPFAEVVLDPAAPKHHHYTPLSEYGRILEVYFEHLQRHRLLVLFTEDLAARPAQLLTEVQDFLGLATPFPSAGLDRRFNAGGTSTRLPWLVPLVRRTPLRILWRALPRRWRLAAGKWYFFELAPKVEAPPQVDAALRGRLVDHFRPDVERLQLLLGRPAPWPEFER